MERHVQNIHLRQMRLALAIDNEAGDVSNDEHDVILRQTLNEDWEINSIMPVTQWVTAMR